MTAGITGWGCYYPIGFRGEDGELLGEGAPQLETEVWLLFPRHTN
jgi:hypothetical protein